MIKQQKYVLAIGLLVLTIAFTFVPFESTYKTRRDNAKAYEGYSLLWLPPHPVKVCIKTFGMQVSRHDSLESITQEANKACYVSPIFSRIFISALATTFATLTIYLLVGATKKRPPSFAPPISTKSEHKSPPQAPSAEQSLAQLLLSELGHSFPVSNGNAKDKDPLVITAAMDYVSVEYAVVRHVLGKLRETYELDSQELLNRDGRQIDKLAFKVKEAGAATWTGQRTFYFDITEGFRHLG